MERKEEIAENLKMFLRENLIELKIPRERRVFLQIKKDALRETIDHLVNVFKIRHLSTITGVDLVSEIGVIYHFSYENSLILSLSITVSKENPVASTITDLIPGAVLYEREVHDLLGVRFEGHPDLSPLILPEGWPEGVYPLRKDCKLKELQELTSVEVRSERSE